MADSVDRGALARVPVVVALWALVPLVGTSTAMRVPCHGPEIRGIAAAVPDKTAIHTVRRAVICMV